MLLLLVSVKEGFYLLIDLFIDLFIYLLIYLN